MMTKCARSATMTDDEISISFDIFRGIAQGGMSSPIIFVVFISCMMAAMEAANKRFRVAAYTGSGFMFADNSAEGSETPDQLQNKKGRR